MNIFMRTTKKLAVQFPNEPPVEFSDEPHRHLLRFETYSKVDDWILTDVDFALEGNPYFTNK
jgi:hypothetical protein